MTTQLPSPERDWTRLAVGRAQAHKRKRKKLSKRSRPTPPAFRDDGPDQLVPDPVVCGELGVSRMTLWRWTNEAKHRHLNFPSRINLNGYGYRSRRMLEQWKQDRIALAGKGA